MTARQRTADDRLKERARSLGLFGLLSNWEEFEATAPIPRLLEVEEAERQRRSLDRRLKCARIGRFKPMADFDWAWPSRIDRDEVEDLLALSFLSRGENAVLIGPSGVGKSMIAQNITHLAVEKGHTVRRTSASEMLNELLAMDGPSALKRRLHLYAHPTLLCIDEVGYLSYDTRHADLLFEVVSRRQDGKSTLVTTNLPFAQWKTVFPNATCVVALVDRLVHKAQVVAIEGDSYRLKEAKEREAQRASERAARRPRRR